MSTLGHGGASIGVARARALVREAGGAELCERLDHLDRSRATSVPEESSPDAPTQGETFDYDVVMAGGGLSLLVAPLLARRGLSVAVFDRARIGEAHREWNASRRELGALTRAGLFTEREVDELVVARYRDGFCKWHDGGTYPVTGTLDCAVDAGLLLTRTRALAEAEGVVLFDGHAVRALTTSAHGARLRVGGVTGTSREVTARVLVEARGSSAKTGADLLCPTVGGVVRGLREGDDPRAIDPIRGEILVTREHVEGGRQHLWEAFPGRTGETTVYLFYYASPKSVADGSLMSLYARFFEKLPDYKDGASELIRPTFGVIPGWSRLGPPPRARGLRTVLVGDAAARQSPLTFCGFGSMLRSLESAAEGIARAADSSSFVESVVDDAPVHAGTGALAMILANPPSAANRAALPNQLLDTAFSVLFEMGDARYGSLLRDEMGLADLTRFLVKTSARMPRVYPDVIRSLGVRNVLRWTSQTLRFA